MSESWKKCETMKQEQEGGRIKEDENEAEEEEERVNGADAVRGDAEEEDSNCENDDEDGEDEAEDEEKEKQEENKDGEEENEGEEEDEDDEREERTDGNEDEEQMIPALSIATGGMRKNAMEKSSRMRNPSTAREKQSEREADEDEGG